MASSIDYDAIRGVNVEQSEVCIVRDRVAAVTCTRWQKTFILSALRWAFAFLLFYAVVGVTAALLLPADTQANILRSDVWASRSSGILVFAGIGILLRALVEVPKREITFRRDRLIVDGYSGTGAEVAERERVATVQATCQRGSPKIFISVTVSTPSKEVSYSCVTQQLNSDELNEQLTAVGYEVVWT